LHAASFANGDRTVTRLRNLADDVKMGAAAGALDKALGDDGRLL
jgi:hypothetical protein